MSRTYSLPSLLSFETAFPLCLDRRKAPRFPCHPETACLLTIDGATDVWAVKVQNLSPGGAKLILNEAVPGDRIQTIGLYNLARGFCCERRAWKVYTYACGDGVFILGIAFGNELSLEEVQELL